MRVSDKKYGEADYGAFGQDDADKFNHPAGKPAVIIGVDG